MSDPKYAYPYPPPQGGYYQGPPVMAPPQYAAPPPKRQPGFLEGWFGFPVRLVWLNRGFNFVFAALQLYAAAVSLMNAAVTLPLSFLLDAMRDFFIAFVAVNCLISFLFSFLLL
ncbi:cysteine-rich and transmembrane domain-containing protein A-like [Cucumis melo var. makuwa]|uniref:Cysteine-rich and transmembrane domain-containing protein A-like n=1 Tax=Cucumis melo var. makuwa TaxID=1194695 RepID=A0A5A7SN04_CUCMM|nr:cysteine-rich and transmembrane domain-containing protein A-like [Cucumis melo var. makuwa]TYK06857.1 cysteine-rich and transmembrane domain-containing protein A-like [Cucumis melo var. makuwa]